MTRLGRLWLVLTLLAGGLVACAAGALLIGSAPVAPRAILDVLLARGPADPTAAIVVLTLRLPRIAAAALAGGALAVAGVGFQGLTRNPLAEPAVIGVSSGAAFGVVAAQLFGLGAGLADGLRLTAFAFAGAVVAGVVVYVVAATNGRFPIQTLLLTGVVVGVFFSAAITALTSVVDPNRLAGVIHWLLGNVPAVTPRSLLLFALVGAVGFWLVAGQARELNILALGEEPALQLGVDAERLKRRVFAGAALLTAAVVAFTGPIGFVGLIVPHALRSVLGSDNRVLAPAALFAGAIFLLAADTLARNVVAPAEVSVGIITAFCGAPFFMYLLHARYRALA